MQKSPAFNPWQALDRWLFAPVPAASIAMFRILFGFLMTAEVITYFSKGWIQTMFAARSFHFTYYGLGWVHPWPGQGMAIHLALLGVAAFCVALGLFYRVASILFFLGYTYVFLIDQTDYNNHGYLICLLALLLACMPAERQFSLDAKWSARPLPTVVPAWCLWLLRMQIGIVYLCGGLAKLNPDWLQGEPMRMVLAHSPFPYEWMVWCFVWGGILIDLSMVPLLLYRRTRRAAIGISLFFHITNSRLFPIGVFPWLMLACTTLFLEPDWPRAAVGPSSKEPVNRAVPVLMGLYLVLQIILPLRYLAYPGNVSWTCQGERFAWRMMLDEKTGRSDFVVTDKVTGQSVPYDATTVLSPRQYKVMSTRPDLLLRFCHWLADQDRVASGHPVEVRVHAEVSLNGRKPQPIVDPQLDLAAQPESLRPAPWILPLTEPLPSSHVSP